MISKVSQFIFRFVLPQGDGMFRIVPEVEPYAWMLSRKVDCRNKELPPYAGNLAFMLPFKREKPSQHAVRIKLCKGATDYDCEGIYTQYDLFLKGTSNLHKIDINV